MFTEQPSHNLVTTQRDTQKSIYKRFTNVSSPKEWTSKYVPTSEGVSVKSLISFPTQIPTLSEPLESLTVEVVTKSGKLESETTILTKQLDKRNPFKVLFLPMSFLSQTKVVNTVG